MSKEVKELLTELIIGVLGFEAVVGILTVIICQWQGYDLLPALVGVLIGFAAVLLMLWDMGVVTDKSVNSGDENYAKQLTAAHATMRKIILFVAFVICWKIPQVNVLTMLIGVMGLKSGVYFQPIVHKRMERTRGTITMKKGG